MRASTRSWGCIAALWAIAKRLTLLSGQSLSDFWNPMPIQTAAQSRLRAAGRIKSRLVDALRDDLAEMAKAGAFAPVWLTPREIGQQLDQTGYWLSHHEPLAPFLSAPQCVTMVTVALNNLTANDARTWWRNDARYRPHRIDWCVRARETADRLRASRPEEARTAIYGGAEDESVIFANEEFANGPTVRREIALLRDNLRAAAICELGFAISTDGGAWVMLVYTASEKLLQSVLFSLWQNCSMNSEEWIVNDEE